MSETNEYMKTILISEIEETLKLAKEKEYEEYSRRERIWFEHGKNVIKQIFAQYFKEVEKRHLSEQEAEYVTERIILAAKQRQVKTLQQTYREYKREGREISKLVTEERLDRIMCCCPKTIEDTKEALDIIYKYIDKYYEKAMKEK